MKQEGALERGLLRVVDNILRGTMVGQASRQPTCQRRKPDNTLKATMAGRASNRGAMNTRESIKERGMDMLRLTMVRPVRPTLRLRRMPERI